MCSAIFDASFRCYIAVKSLVKPTHRRNEISKRNACLAFRASRYPSSVLYLFDSSVVNIEIEKIRLTVITADLPTRGRTIILPASRCLLMLTVIIHSDRHGFGGAHIVKVNIPTCTHFREVIPFHFSPWIVIEHEPLWGNYLESRARNARLLARSKLFPNKNWSNVEWLLSFRGLITDTFFAASRLLRFTSRLPDVYLAKKKGVIVASWEIFSFFFFLRNL